MNSENIYEIGTQYIPVGKNRDYVCTVTDILRTYNSKNELVMVRYIAQHEFMGQLVTDPTVVQPTIARGIVKLNESNKARILGSS